MNSKVQSLTVSAPGRCGIIGNPTDMYGGNVLSCSLPLRARVTLTVADSLILQTAGEQIAISSQKDLHPQGDRFDLARAILDYLHLPPSLKCHIHYDSDIPMKSGLAGSTALTVALTQALALWQGEKLSRYQLAERARYIELNYLKVVCGYQDAYMAAFGGLNFMGFAGKQFYRSQEGELFASVERLGDYVPSLPFVLALTGVQHSSGAVHRPIRERWLEGDAQVVASYERIAELARMGKKALLLQDWPTLGRLMNENHAIQRELGGSGVSNERLIAAALAAGALGAKLAGAGNGGTIIILWPQRDRAKLEAVLRAAEAVAFVRPQVVAGVRVDE